MKQEVRDHLDEYYKDAASWAEDRAQGLLSSRRVAWIIASVAAAVALLEAGALILLTPLKTVVPYALLVDRQTGYVTTVDPLSPASLTADTALTRSFIAQYVIAREGFAIDSLRTDYRKVALWSADQARERYIANMQASNPTSPLATLPRRAVVQVQIRSVTSLGDNTSLVRFTTVRTDPGGQAQPPQYWAAAVSYRYNTAAMSADDRLLNPLGFQVVRYRKDAETPPEPVTPARPTELYGLQAVRAATAAGSGREGQE